MGRCIFVQPHGTTLFGFKFATVNIAMVPNYANIMLMCHVILNMKGKECLLFLCRFGSFLLLLLCIIALH